MYLIFDASCQKKSVQEVLLALRDAVSQDEKGCQEFGHVPFCTHKQRERNNWHRSFFFTSSNIGVSISFFTAHNHPTTVMEARKTPFCNSLIPGALLQTLMQNKHAWQ